MARDDEARRAYWAAQMEDAYRFMTEVLEWPVVESGDGVVSIQEAARDAGVQMEFSDKCHAGGLPRLYVMRERLVPSLVAAAREMNERGWVMRVEDGYRTSRMQKLLGLQPETFEVVLRQVLWECRGRRPTAELMLRRLSALVATRPKVATHMSASAVDISVMDRRSGAEVARGGPYLEMSVRTPMASPFVPAEARENRRAITELMRRHGFAAYPWEFWHYSGGDAFYESLNATGDPARYGPVEVELPSGSVTPITEPARPLHMDAEMVNRMEQALERLEEERSARGTDGGAAPGE